MNLAVKVRNNYLIFTIGLFGCIMHFSVAVPPLFAQKAKFLCFSTFSSKL